MSETGTLRPALVEAFERLCAGDLAYRLPRTFQPDEDDTTADFFNAVAEQLERNFRAAQDQEQRLSRAIDELSDALTRFAAGDRTVEVERDHRGDAADVLVSLVNQTIGELASLTAERARRAEEERQRLEELVRERTAQLEASEEDFRRLFEGSPAPMLLVTADGRHVRSCNERAAAMLRAAPTRLVGQNVSAIFADGADLRGFLGALARDGAVEGRTVLLRTSTGDDFWALLNARALVHGEDPAVMLSFADLTEQKRVEGELRLLANTDSLTGTMNRGHFYRVAGEERTRARRFGHPLSLAMFDLDHFKRLNDRFGHHVGDEALRRVAEALQAGLRPDDQIGRYGGEEFAILLPGTALAQAVSVMDRLRGVVASIELFHEGERVLLSASVGVAECSADEPIDAALRRADEALYAAKAAGRDRVVAHE